VLARWIEHLEKHLNEGSKSKQIGPVDLRDDGVDIYLPSREKIEVALKYLKNNKVPGGRGRGPLKNGGPNVVNALHEVILEAWTSETLPKS
jgi:hypothetical protein